jgi:hypothetical protein
MDHFGRITLDLKLGLARNLHLVNTVIRMCEALFDVPESCS